MVKERSSEFEGREVTRVARRARRRLFQNELLREGANAISFWLALIIVLLVAGADVVDWRILAIVSLAAGAFALRRAFVRTPSEYHCTQIVDHRLKLADTLSTSVYLHSHEVRHAAFRRAQLQRAEEVAKTADLRKALPLQAPRAAYGTLALFLVATSLFALRFAGGERLGFRKPLARGVVARATAEDPERVAQAKQPEPDQKSEDQKNSTADPVRLDEGKRASRGDRNAESGKRGEESAKSESRKQQGDGEAAGKESPQRTQQKRDQLAQNESGSPREGGREQQGDSGKQGGQGESSGILDRFRDAVKNLMSKMSPQGGGKQNGQSARNERSEAQNQGQQQNQSESAGSDAASGKGQADRAAQDAGDGASRGAKQATGQQEGKQPGSGIGAQDGNKELKEAERLAAMGKISEILGKRAKDISGEATIQVDSGTQRLSTPYGKEGMASSMSGGEIGRDEVPIALQAYVQRYFEEVRKQRKK